MLAAVVTGCATYGDGSGPRGISGSQRSPDQAPTVYTVERGDTLYSIAWRYDLRYERVAQWNNISPPYTIYPGQKIRLRAPVEGSDGGGGKAAKSDDGQAGSSSASSAAGSRRSASDHDWQWPAHGDVVREYAQTDYGKKGISIGDGGDGDVLAAETGRVVYSGNGLRGYGNLVIVKHGPTYLTAYGYNKELLVAEGDEVGAGDPIARMGQTPDGQTAVHFELRRNGEPVNPLQYLPAR